MVTLVTLDPATQVLTRPSRDKIKHLKKFEDCDLLFKTKTQKEKKEVKYLKSIKHTSFY